MTEESKIREVLISACETRGKMAEIAAAFEVSPSTVKRWIEGGEIPPPMVKLLRLYLLGEIPFGLVHPRKEELSSILEFEPDEWRIIEILATRAGQTPGQWIRSQILAYLAYSKDAQALRSDSAMARPKASYRELKVLPSARVAEDPSPAPRHWIELRGGVAAGAPILSHELADKVAVGQEYPGDHYALRVFGASMEPKIPDGSTIIVRSWSEPSVPRKGTTVVYSDGSGSTLKEFAYRKAKAGEEGDAMGNVPVLRSLNKAFPDIQAMDGGKIDACFVELV